MFRSFSFCTALLITWILEGSMPTMASRYGGSSSQAELVRHLKDRSIIKSERVERAMLAVDRRYYVQTSPYMDSPQSIGYRATISAPHMHAHSLEYLKNHLTDGKRGLDIGSGTGYLTACMAVMVGSRGKVVGIEHIPELVNTSIENVRMSNPDLISSKRVILVAGDGRKGYPSEAPYDAIHVGAAAATIPQPLIDQLKPGGRMVIPVGPEHGEQYFKVVDMRQDGTLSIENQFGVAYVPLTDRKKQWPKGDHSDSTEDHSEQPSAVNRVQIKPDDSGGNRISWHGSVIMQLVLSAFCL